MSPFPPCRFSYESVAMWALTLLGSLLFHPSAGELTSASATGSGVVLSASLTSAEFFRGRADATVQWAMPSSDVTDDLWMAVYSPADYSHFVQYANVTDATGTWTMSLLPAREDFVFKLWRGNHPMVHIPATGKFLAEAGNHFVSHMDPKAGNGAELLGTSNPLKPDSDWPMQIRTTLIQSAHGQALRVTWTTGSKFAGTVIFGEHPDLLTFSALSGPASTYTYQELDQCPTKDGTAKSRYFHPGFFHSALLTDLRPGLPVYYQVAGHDTVFRHVGLPNPEATSMSFIYTADIGIGPSDFIGAGYEFGVFDETGFQIDRTNDGPGSGGALVLAHIAANEDLEKAAFFIANGDVSYACGAAWLHERFQELIHPIISRVPIYTSVGNHEFDHQGQTFKPIWADFSDDSGGDCGIPYRARWMMPEAEIPLKQLFNDTLDGHVPFYSFDSSIVHVAVLATEVDFTSGSPQHDWLQADLAAVDRSVTPYVIVISHRQLYSVMDSEQLFNEHSKAELVPILERYNVDLHMGAHVHSYERSCPLRAGKCVTAEEGGITYIVDGSAGAYVASFGPVAPLPEWTLHFNDKRYGYTRIVVDLEELRAEHVVVPSGSVVDSVVIPNRHADSTTVL